VGNYDRVVIQELLKDIAQTQQVDVSAKHRFKGPSQTLVLSLFLSWGLTCTVVVINEADNLTRDAQSALRRTMEKYSPNLRLILVANSSTKILAPIRSRCLLVRVAAPTQTDIVDVLKSVAQAEDLGKIAPGVLEKIAMESKRNLRRALLMLEAVYAQKYPPLAVWWVDVEILVVDLMIQRLRLFRLIGRFMCNKLLIQLLRNNPLSGTFSTNTKLIVEFYKFGRCFTSSSHIVFLRLL